MNELLIATRKGLFLADAQPGAPRISRAAFLGDNVSMALRDPRDGAIYAALDHGHFGVKLHRSMDDMETWQECAPPAFPRRPEGAPEDLDPTSGKPLPSVVLRVWALEPGHAPGTLYCGTIPGGLFRSDDRGDSWSLVRSLWDHPGRKQWFGGGADYPGIHSICVHPRRAGHLLVGVSCGGVWITEDDGETWSCRAQGMWAAYMPPERRDDPLIQDPHRIVACPAQPDRLWAQHHNGVFRSIDGAASWQEVQVPPSSFGFAAAVHPTDPDTAWLVPAQSDERRIPVGGQVVVARTRDGGRSFELLRAGLPQEHAYDLVYRHALDVAQDGERLAFGSTTGSLWLTFDQGDSWQALSHHLPPIHAVRFCA
jgi:hypothetical protein